jgi:tripartite-type tricarboxylate transporter receptor subunit TctC
MEKSPVRLRHLFAAAAVVALSATTMQTARAQEWPSRDIKVLCAYAPGTGADIVVRYFAEKLRAHAKQTLVVENRVGAFTTIATDAVVRSRPDGYTLLITPGNALASLPALMKKLPFDPQKDLTPVTTLIKLPFLLVVDPKSPANTAVDLISQQRAKGDKGSYGYPNDLALSAGELLKERTGLKTVQVPYKSTPEALNDMAGGNIDYLWSDATFGLAQAKAGRMRVLAVTSATRSSLAPDVPTMQEAGVRDFDLVAWWGAYYPAGTPKPIVDKMSGWLNAILASDEAKAHFANVAPSETFPGTPESARDYLAKEIPKWGEAFRMAKIEPQ